MSFDPNNCLRTSPTVLSLTRVSANFTGRRIAVKIYDPLWFDWAVNVTVFPETLYKLMWIILQSAEFGSKWIFYPVDPETRP